MEDQTLTQTLTLENLPLHLRTFLDAHFHRPADLAAAPTLNADLRARCSSLDRDLAVLAADFADSASEWESRVGMVREVLDRARSDRGLVGKERVLGVELESIATEVRRIEAVRMYAETALRLEALVGDLEDATLSHMGQNSSSTTLMKLSNSISLNDFEYKHENLLSAIEAVKGVEDILVTVVKNKPRWARLIAAVDSRVEKSLSILRPQALRDHRAILSSLGWPPPLILNTGKESSEIPNPLVLLLGEKKEKFSRSFLSLCSLQHVHSYREARLSIYEECRKGFKGEVRKMSRMLKVDQNLWAINELVFPLASRMEHHFSRWSEEPKFIFTLVYKISRDFLEGVDNILQPLIDKARLAGYSAKEAWVLAMIEMLSSYLISAVFPVLAKNYDTDGENIEVISSWLHWIDLIISFDKQMLALASSGILMNEGSGFAENSLPLLLSSIFHDHYDWLQIWAETELRDAESKLKSELEDETVWVIATKQETELDNEDEGAFLFSTREDHKAPPIAESIVKIAWAMIGRCQTLPSVSMRTQYILSSACVLLNWFFIVLLQRIEGIDFTAVITEDRALLRLVGSVNAARYCESITQEWCEDVSFIELSIQASASSAREDGTDPRTPFFQDEINNMIKIETDCLEDIMSSLLLEFDFLSRDYMQEHIEAALGGVDGIPDTGGLNISSSLVEALDRLRERLRTLRINLNSKDFADLWRSISSGIDHFIFKSITSNKVKFSTSGVDQFKVDMKALFLIFKPLCVRPEAFFPLISDTLKLLDLHPEDAQYFIGDQTKENEKTKSRLLQHKISHLTPIQANTILSNTHVDLKS